ncbi:5350_t:CDS:2, partial [Cetraspora pellucida]
ECLQNTVSEDLQNTVSQASQVSINRDNSGESLQENFFDSKSLLFDKSQHTNDLKYNSFMTSDTSSVVTFNLPQGKILVDTKHHIGNLGCRSCLVPKEQLSDLSFDIPSSTQIVNEIVLCWVAVAKASRLSFSFTFTEQTYKELDNALKIEHILLLK